MTKIFIGADHAGFNLKTELLDHLILECETEDCGTTSLERTDYPIFANAVVSRVLQDTTSVGVLLCSTGIGMSIAANRHKGIRAALCHTVKDVKQARQHNNANILVMGADNLSPDEAVHMVRTFLNTTFQGGRYEQRLAQIDQ